MWRILLAGISVAVLFAAEDPWSRVQELKSGSELRIYKKGSRQPVTATLYEATAERIVVIVKNEQSAIAKADIDQLDARPAAAKKGLKPTVQTTARPTEPDFTPQPHNAAPVPGTSYGSSVAFGSRPDFETVYRRSATSAPPSTINTEIGKKMPPETTASPTAPPQ